MQAAMVSTLPPLGAALPRALQPTATSLSRGFVIERHFSVPGQCLPLSGSQHLISLLCSRPVRLEYRSARGETISQIKQPGTLTVCPAGSSPEIRIHDRVEHFHCTLEDDFIRTVAQELDARPTGAPSFQAACRNPSIAGLIHLLIEESESENKSGKFYEESLAHALATRYLLLDVSPDAKPERGVSALPARLVARVRQKIEADLQADLSLSCLAKETGYSREHFLRMFRSATGLTPHQYIVDLRLQHCRDWLNRRDANLIDIAAVCGFSNQSHMTSVFRKRFGVTPAEFRRGLLR